MGIYLLYQWSWRELFIEQSILSSFKNSRKCCLFFFDCCLFGNENSEKSTEASKMFKLTDPVKCLVAYATATGYKSQGDKFHGGLWTRTLCAKLKEPLPLSAILDELIILLQAWQMNSHLTMNHVLVQWIWKVTFTLFPSCSNFAIKCSCSYYLKGYSNIITVKMKGLF